MTRTLIGAALALGFVLALPSGAHAADHYDRDIQGLFYELTRLRSELGTPNRGCERAGYIEYCYDDYRDYEDHYYGAPRLYEYTNYSYDYNYGAQYDYEYDYDYRYEPYRYSDTYYYSPYVNNSKGFYDYYTDGLRPRDIDDIDVSFANDRTYVWVDYHNGKALNYVYQTQNPDRVVQELADDLNTSPRSIAAFIDWDYTYQR